MNFREVLAPEGIFFVEDTLVSTTRGPNGRLQGEANEKTPLFVATVV